MKIFLMIGGLFVGLIYFTVIQSRTISEQYDIFYHVLKEDYYLDSDSTKFATIEIRVYPPRKCDSGDCIKEFVLFNEAFNVSKQPSGKLELFKYQERFVSGRWKEIEGYAVVHLIPDSILINNDIVYKRFPPENDEYYNDLWLFYTGESIDLYHYYWKTGEFYFYCKFEQSKPKYKNL